MSLRKRLKKETKKSLDTSNVSVTDNAVRLVVEQALAVASGLSIRYGRVEFKPNQHDNRDPFFFVEGAAPGIREHVASFIKEMITPEVIERARESSNSYIERENKSYDRWARFVTDNHEALEKQILVHISKVAVEIAKADAKRIFEMVKENLKQS